jgi:hypothetical protein
MNASQSGTSSNSGRALTRAFVASRKVRGRARPWPIFRPRAETRSHRVALDVPDGGEQMLLIHHEGVETLLPEMPFPALAKIDHASVSAMRLPQRIPRAQRVSEESIATMIEDFWRQRDEVAAQSDSDSFGDAVVDEATGLDHDQATPGSSK